MASQSALKEIFRRVPRPKTSCVGVTRKVVWTVELTAHRTAEMAPLKLFRALRSFMALRPDILVHGLVNLFHDGISLRIVGGKQLLSDTIFAF